MVGAHDVGGRKGLGPIRRDKPGDPPFKAPWEGEVIGLTITTMAQGLIDVDTWRARQEELHPLVYGELPYFERWLYSVEMCLTSRRVLTPGEIENRVREIEEDPEAPLPEREDPAFVAAMAALIAGGAPIFSEPEQPPRYSVGDQVRLRQIEILEPGIQHTRIPSYAKGKAGEIARINPAHNLPDAMVEHREAKLEHTYVVKFAASDLWDDGDPSATVSIDAWESYLEQINPQER